MIWVVNGRGSDQVAEDDGNGGDTMFDEATEEKRLEKGSNGTASRDSVGIYLRDIRRFPLLKKDEETRVAWRVRSGDEEARAELIAR
ncbi:MAG: sigma-70 factor domain-containing protein, partial [Candidatus Eisenbacteria bacterium]